MKTVWVERKMRNKRKQKALMQYWMPQNATLVREALHDAGRQDLIGRSHNSLVAHSDGGGGRGRRGEHRPPAPKKGRGGRGKPPRRR